MAKIKQITAREILDSRGNPTVETMVELADGIIAKSAVPSGAVQSTYEAIELRDNDKNRYGGMGVKTAIENVNKTIAKEIVGMDVLEQQKIDKTMIELDGTQNKSKLGANAILSVSQAVAKAAARSSLLPTSLYLRQFVNGNLGKKMPTPMFNLIEGGKHSGNTLNFQEFLVIPATSKTYSESLEMGAGIYRSLRKLLFEKGFGVLNAEEGGFGPNLSTNQSAFVILKQAIEQAEYSFSLDVFMGLDASANTFIDGKMYRIKDKAIPYTPQELGDFYKMLLSEFALVYLEDPFAEDDWEAWKMLSAEIGSKTLISGDDLTTTNPYRLQLALDNKTIGGVVIKPNQIGTVTESIAVVEIARFTGLKIIVSQRSGETMDTFISDFAVGVGADYVKFGAPARERVAKYNKLLQIEKDLESL